MRDIRNFVLCVAAAFASPGVADSVRAARYDGDRPVREIYVPAEDLDVLLQSQPNRVLLKRPEYDELLRRARKRPESHAPQAALFLSADYSVQIGDGRALWTGVLAVEVLEEGLHAVPLELSGVGLREASLDGKPAAIGKRLTGDSVPGLARGPASAPNPPGVPVQPAPPAPATTTNTPVQKVAREGYVLFVAGVGRHELTLQLVSPLETTAAEQVLRFRVPRPSASRMRLSVPGDVEVEGGASVIHREVDETDGKTRFELLAPVGDATLVMTLNNRIKRHNRVVAARSVLVDEITAAYERLHATVSLGVLHGAVDDFRFVVPQGFDITEVKSPQVARWAMQTDAGTGRQILDVHLREASTETIVLNVSAIRSSSPLGEWGFPRFEPLDVVSQVAVVGILTEERLRAEAIRSGMLIQIDTSDLLRALPETVFKAEPGAAPLRPVAAYYAPDPDFRLNARFDRPPAKMNVVTNALLIVDEQSLEARGQFLLTPKVEELFRFDFQVPDGWRVTGVTTADETPLDFEEDAGERGRTRVRVRMPTGIAPGSSCPICFTAQSAPDGWLGDWQSRPIEFPVFAAADAARDIGAIAVEARGDLVVRPGPPDTFTLLTPLDDAEKLQYGLTDVGATLVYRYEAPGYSAGLVVDRTQPRVTARTFSFLRIASEGMTAHYEIAYQVEAARAARLLFTLPDTTPESLAVRGLDGVGLKEYTSQAGGEGKRLWQVLLAEPRTGAVRLAVDFQQPLPSQEPKDFALPLVEASGVAYQSGFFAVEGHPELDVQVKAKSRAVDVGELVDAEYQPGRGLLGVFGFVGAPPAASVDVVRHPGYPLDPAIVQQAELITQLSAEGICQTAARYELRVKVPYLTVQLPHGAKLWSADLDGQPIKPQQKGENLLVSIPAADAGKIRTLRIVYEDTTAPVVLEGGVELRAPRLYLPDDANRPPAEVPAADMFWRLRLPTGYEVTASDGTLVAELPLAEPAAIQVVKWTLGLLFYAPTFQTARESSSGGNRLYQLGLAFPSNAPESDAAVDMPSRPSAEYFEHVEGVPASEAEGGFRDTMQGGERRSNEAGTVVVPNSILDDGIVPSSPAGQPSAAAMVTSDDVGRRPAPPSSVSPTPGTAARGKGIRGLNSLKIELAEAAPQDQGEVVFRSLGVEPRLQVSLACRPRFNSLGWAFSLAVVLVGLAMASASVRAKVVLILGIIVLGTLIPLVPGLEETAVAANMAVFTASLLVPFYLLFGCSRWFIALFQTKPAAIATTAVSFAMLLFVPGVTKAESPAKGGPYVIQVVEPDVPVVVPEDAVILPYDPNAAEGVALADRILVPYAKYIELWNRAYPDKKQNVVPPPASYSLAGASYRSSLIDDEYLELQGQIDIDVFVERPVSIPLGLGGGVLTEAELDGAPARLSMAQPQMPPAPQQQVVQQREEPPVSSRQLVLLQAEGKGRHALKVSVRMQLQRRGGWRVVEGVVPSAPAAALELTVPRPQTELRLGEVEDRRNFDTTEADEKIETVLGPGGAVGIRWRPKVAEAQVDRSLTSRSSAVLDVQEDGLGVAWELSLEFPRSQREAFGISVPEGYLVKSVEGANVRGWEISKADNRQKVDISLLNTARDAEQFILRLWRELDQQESASAEFDVPVVTVADAALAGGRLTIRRSPMLDLRLVSTSGVTRTDLPTEIATASAEESPLGLRPFQAYAFVATPFSIRLAASPVRARVLADVQTIVKIAEYERNMESRIILDVQNRPIYRVEVLLPEGLDLPLESVSAPGQHEWAVTEQNGRHKLSIYLATGQQGLVSVVLRGKLARQAATEPLSLPRLEVLDVERQEGNIAIQADPAFAVRTADLRNCQSVLLSRLHAWLDPEQQKATRLALHTDGGDYGGRVLLSIRLPRVTCDTITNVRVTERAVEETILLDFSINSAGIRELSFLLPAAMKGCRVSVPMLRQKTDEPADAGADSPRRIRIQLQDEVIHTLRVLVEQDRPLSAEPPAAPIPVLETAGRAGTWEVGRQFVALQNAGRDELVVREARGLAELNRQQKEWLMLRNTLKGGITRAYLARGDGDLLLRYSLDERKAVEMAGARIRFAETDLVVDASGAYRGRQVYRLDNATEQFLKIKLPEGARLWTAEVAGTPVKPIVPADTSESGLVEIPLVKTAEGDLDFGVVLKYGGKSLPLQVVAEIQFPLIHARGINVELSQVRLHLPETYRWFDFRGTMTPVAEEGDLAAGYLSYQTKVAERLMKTAEHASGFAQVRAAENLKNLKQAIQAGDFYSSGEGVYSRQLQQEYEKNTAVLRDAEQQIDRLEQVGKESGEIDNRYRLNDLYTRQEVNRARNVVQGLGDNFDAPTVESMPAESAESSRFNSLWFDKSQLSNAAGAEGIVGAESAGKRLAMPEKPSKDAAPKSKTAAQGQFQSPVFKKEMALNRSEQEKRGQAPAMDESRERQNMPSNAVSRYQEQLRSQQQAQPQRARGVQSDRNEAMDGQSDRSSGRQDNFQVFGRVVEEEPSAEVVSGLHSPGVFSADLDIPFQREARGLASLDVELPQRGVVYRFKMPGGDVDISARAASKHVIRNVGLLVLIVIGLALVLVILRVVAAGRLDWAAGRTASAVFLALGLAMFLFLPMLGLVLVVAAVMATVRRALNRRLPNVNG